MGELLQLLFFLEPIKFGSMESLEAEYANLAERNKVSRFSAACGASHLNVGSLEFPSCLLQKPSHVYKCHILMNLQTGYGSTHVDHDFKAAVCALQTLRWAP